MTSSITRTSWRRSFLASSAAVAASVIFSGSTIAQRADLVPQAFAAVQAPESAAEVCHATSVQAALDCARKRCQRKAGRGACFAVTACEPSGWAGMMGVRVSEVHFAKAICGAPSQDALMTALKAFCLGHSGLRECDVTHIWGPDGKLSNVSINWTPQSEQKTPVEQK